MKPFNKLTDSERKRKYDSLKYDFIKPEWFQLPLHFHTDSPLQKLKRQMISRNGESHQKKKRYSECRKEAAELRKHILSLVKSEETPRDSGIIPNDEECNLIRYYYYINQGVDIANIPSLEQSWIKDILGRVSGRNKCRKQLMKELLNEINEDFIFSIKKSVIDFTLQDYDSGAIELPKPKFTLLEIYKRMELFYRIRNKIAKNLFVIHPTVVKISQLWYQQYRLVRIINVKELYALNALDLNQFKDWLASQIKLCKTIIFEKWIPSVFKIVSNAIKKKLLFHISEKKLPKFYETLCTLMTLQLQALGLKTIFEYTDFVCDVKKSPGFQVHVLYKNNKIIFNPSFNEFRCTLLNVFDELIHAIEDIPRIETKLFVKNANYDSPFLKPLILPAVVDDCRDKVEETLKNEWICPELKIQDFDEYVCLINGQSRIEVNKFLSDDRPFELFKMKVAYYHDLSTEIALASSRVVSIGTFEIHREHFISILINKSQATKDRFLCKISDTYQDACRCLNEEFQLIKDTLLKPPINTAELVQMKLYCLNLGVKVFFEMEDRLRETMNYILFCSEYVPLTSVQIKQNSVTFLWYRRISAILEENRTIIKEKTQEFQELLINRISNFKQNLEKYEKEVAEFQFYRDASELSKYLKKAQHLYKKLNMAKDRIKEFNEEEVAFGWMQTSYPKRDEIVDKLAPYKMLYENCADYKNKYQIWTEAKVGTFQPIDIEKDVETFHDNIIELSKQFSSIPAPYALTNSIRQDVEQFQGYMPIVNTLGNPCLKERHWEKISEIVGFPIRVEDDLTLAKILDYGLDEYVPKFQVISDSATKENNLEMRLNQMITEWKDMKFKIIPYRDSGTYILTTAEDIQILLDDHIVKTQMMKNSPYIKPFENTIHSWEEKLILLQEIIDAWFCVQKNWLFLEPIFTFSDIQHQMPEESKRFGAIDKIWKDIMKAASSNTSVLMVIGIEKMLERLGKCNTLLNMIQKGLGSYLNVKRLFFPRFFFLSDEEILDIISNTRDPMGVQPFLKKCFGGIDKLQFNDDSDITGIVSSFEENLPLNEMVNTNSRRGHVEKWLADLENIMKNSVKEKIIKSMQEYHTINYEDWMTSSIQQVICLVFNIVATSSVCKNLKDLETLDLCFEEYSDKIEKMTNKLKNEMKMKNRFFLESLLMYSVRVRDVINLLTKKQHFQNRMAEKDMHLGYYVEGNQINLRMVNCCIEYGYEYVGNYTPLVITPTTDKCYKSFFIAFKYNLGVYLEGPSGIGKSELIKDFAKIAAKHCIIFGCFKKLDYSVVEKFFKGIIASDSWVCFDNLNTVSDEGLLVIDHYAMCIQQSTLFNEDNIKFNGTNFKFTCNHLIFATSNPQFHSNTPLPAAMKTYFRRVRFDCNEYRNILEMKMFLLGFKNYQSLVEKVEAVFSICDELFQGQNNFQYNSRTVSNILKNINNLKTNHRAWEEHVIIQSAIIKTCEPLLKCDDKSLLNIILGNVFGYQKPEKEANEFSNLVEKVCKINNFIYDLDIAEKIQQLYAAITHNVGLIIVGNVFTGKTTLLRILAQVIKLNEQKSPDEDVETVIINPKSVTLQQLYGHQDLNTGEWVDGIFSAHYRKFVKSENAARKWLIFDGPVDPSWMEKLSSVLDDSKKLCLKSGESLCIRKNMNLIFETDHLKDVSPPMISRCGVIFVDQNSVQWKYIISSWVNNLSVLNSQFKGHVEAVAFRFGSVLFHFIDTQAENLVYPATKNVMIRSLCNIFDCFMDDFNDEVFQQNTSEIDIRSQLEGVLFFSCIWSVGAFLSKEDKQKFDILFRALQQKEFPKDVKEIFNIPDELCTAPAKQYVYIIPDYGTVFDYQYIKEGKGKWKLWSESVMPTSVIPRDVQFHQIIVPTKATIRNQNLMSMLLNHHKQVLLVGETATGKTVDIKYFLNNKLDRNTYKPIYLNFSAGTTGNLIQRLINSNLDKRKKGVYGPPLGMRYVLFIDDINASTPNKYGTYSAIELLRHFLEYKQWYNTDTASPVQLVDLQMICSLTFKHDGTNYGSYSRFCRHFNFICNDVFDDETLKSIFSKIMLWHLDTRGFSKEFDPCIDQIVDATLAVHRLVQANLFPVPHKCLYIFNMRDFSRIIQGVVLSVPEAIEDLSAMKRLWVHEVMRIYHDKIINQEDSNWFMNKLKHVTKQQLKENLDELLNYLLLEDEVEVNQFVLRRLIFCDFINPKADVRNYAEVQDMEGLQSIVEGYLVEHNNVNKKPMNLILFPYAIEHISRICRILKQPQGHALLLGECGSGKQSLARLAIHMCEYEFFEVELTSRYDKSDWRKDMKSLLTSVYTDQHSAFLFNNIQMMKDSMLEDVCNLLQTGEIPEIFDSDDMKEIFEKMEVIDNQRDKSLQTNGSHEALYNLFHQRVRKQIHVVLVFNASIYELRKYIHKFPAFNNCCSIDWFQSWPENAQQIVSRKLFNDMKWEMEEFQAMTKICEMLHNAGKDVAIEAADDLNIKLYFTQKSFIRLITTFKNLYIKNQQKLQTKRKLLDKSLQKLASIKEQIPFLERECETLQPTIHDKKIQVEQLEKEVESEKEVETEAEILTNGARTIMNNCEKKLNIKKNEYDQKVAEVQNIWENVCETLQSFTSADVTFLKTMKNPPRPLRLVVEALALIKEVKPEKVQESGKVVEDFWRPTIKLVSDAKFIDSLVNFDKSDVSPRVIRLLEEKILGNEDFDADKIKSCSLVADGIYRWTMVVYEYNQVTKMDSDVKLNLNEAEEEFAIAKSNFLAKEKSLEGMRKKRADLINNLEKGRKELEFLEKKENLCYKKKLRAEELVQILERKKNYWIEKKDEVDEICETLIGDILLSAAVITYLTALPEAFRNEKIQNWHLKITSLGMPCRSKFSISSILMDEIDIDKEFVMNLPKDDFFADNLAIIRNSGRYALLVDPQNIMAKWIKYAKKNGLVIIRPDCPDYLHNLESAITAEHPVLLERVGESLDTILYPLLEKRYFKTPNGMFIKLGESSIEYKPDLELYLTTNIENPHYPPEIHDKVNIVNCAMPESSLQNFILRLILTRDRPDLNSERIQITSQFLDLKRTMIEAEMKIISALSSDQDVLESDDELNIITTSNLVIDENNKKISEIDSRLEAIKATALEYNVNAKHFANLFQISGHLRNLSDTYQFSLEWFGNLIGNIVERIEKTGKSQQRCENITESVLRNFFSVTSYSLSDTDKLVFACLVAFDATKQKSSIDKELKCLSNFTIDEYRTGEKFRFTTELMKNLNMLNEVNGFETIESDIQTRRDVWRNFMENGNIPNPWDGMDNLHQLLISLCFNSVNTIETVNNFVKGELGNEYISERFDLNSVYKDSRCSIPIALILSKDCEPVKKIFKCAIDMGISVEKCTLMTLTKSIIPFKNELENAISVGSWIILRNLHEKLFCEFEKIYEELLTNTIHPDFRLWLIVESKSYYPVSILQNSLLVSYCSSTEIEVQSIRKEISCRLRYTENPEDSVSNEFIFKLVAFHQILLETPNISRWNDVYSFSDTDFSISFHEIDRMLKIVDRNSLEQLINFVCDCCYGNQISDVWDQGYLKTLLRSFWNQDILEKIQSGKIAPNNLTCSTNLTEIDPPESYEFINEISTLKRERDAKLFIERLLKAQATNKIIRNRNDYDILKKIDEIVNSLVGKLDANSMNDDETILDRTLRNELNHFNITVDKLQTKLAHLKSALIGKLYLSDELELLWNNLKYRDTIPFGCFTGEFVHEFYLSLEYCIELIRARHDFLQNWLKNGLPEEYNFLVLEYSKIFMSSNLLQYALLSKTPVNEFFIDTEVVFGEFDKNKGTISINGLTIKNAKWSIDRQQIESCQLGTFCEMPQITFTPKLKSEMKSQTKYNCPVYKTSTENDHQVFLTTIFLPTDINPEYWIKRRVKIVNTKLNK